MVHTSMSIVFPCSPILGSRAGRLKPCRIKPAVQVCFTYSSFFTIQLHCIPSLGVVSNTYTNICIPTRKHVCEPREAWDYQEKRYIQMTQLQERRNSYAGGPIVIKIVTAGGA